MFLPENHPSILMLIPQSANVNHHSTAAFTSKSAHMVLQSQQLLQLLIFLIDQILSRFLEELFPCCAVACFICRYLRLN